MCVCVCLFVCLFVGWLAGWLVGWLVGWCVCVCVCFSLGVYLLKLLCFRYLWLPVPLFLPVFNHLSVIWHGVANHSLKLYTVIFNTPLMKWGAPTYPLLFPTHPNCSPWSSLYFGALLSAQSCTSTRPLWLPAARWRWRKLFRAQATRNLRWT